MRRAGGISAAALLLLAAFVLGVVLARGSGSAPVLFLSPRDEHESARLIDEVRQQLAVGYYRNLDSTVLGQETIPEILDAIGDPYTDYLGPERYEALQGRIEESYSGVGLNVGPAEDGIRVTSALSGPAREAGIRPGDVIARVNGRSTRDLPFERSLALIRDEKRGAVRLVVKRPRVGTMRFTIVREQISLPAVRSRLLVAGKTKVGYLRLFSFRESTGEDVARKTAALVKRGAKGMILDLRDNPGGLVSEAVDVASVFLAEGIVCTTASEHGEPLVYEVAGRALYPKLPLVVIVNRGSGSAAEILAAAFADHRRAALLGERTYGKASVQTVRELSNGGALKLTTATYRTPAGSDLTDRGVRPKVKARDNPKTSADEALAAAQAALLDRTA